MSLVGPSSGCLPEKDKRRVVVRLNHLQRIPRGRRLGKIGVFKKALCLDSSLDCGRPCAYFSEGRQILENARAVHPGARSIAKDDS